MKTISTLSAARSYLQEKGFSTCFDLTPIGLWDEEQQSLYPYKEVRIIECIEVKEQADNLPTIRVFALLVAKEIKGLFIEIIVI